jgi:hypothetical protein
MPGIRSMHTNARPAPRAGCALIAGGDALPAPLQPVLVGITSNVLVCGLACVGSLCPQLLRCSGARCRTLSLRVSTPVAVPTRSCRTASASPHRLLCYTAQNRSLAAPLPSSMQVVCQGLHLPLKRPPGLPGRQAGRVRWAQDPGVACSGHWWYPDAAGWAADSLQARRRASLERRALCFSCTHPIRDARNRPCAPPRAQGWSASTCP